MTRQVREGAIDAAGRDVLPGAKREPGRLSSGGTYRIEKFANFQL